jgi:DNA-directed RNA polymerase subunit RPC12/RpoP
MSAPRVFICMDCGKRFSSSSSLNMHVSAMKGRKDHTPRLPEKKRATLLSFLKRIFGGK